MKKLNLKNLCSTMLSRGGQNFRNIENGFERIQEEYICNFNKPKKKGFTLAETLITLTILGVVAAITIPMLINRQQEAANRTKVKKAMTVYEKALNNMIIENDLKSNNAIITFGAEGGACANTTAYFKKVEGDGCRFKTADRIWWDITDIENPLIILNDKNKDKEVAELKTLAKDTNDITTYAMIGRLDETTNAGIVRINDNAFEQANGTADQKAYMSKLWNFIGGIKGNNQIKNITCINDVCKALNNEDCDSVICKGMKGLYSKDTCEAKYCYMDYSIYTSSNCGNCIDKNGKYIYDENNMEFARKLTNYDKCKRLISVDDCWMLSEYDENGKEIAEYFCDLDMKNCVYSWKTTYNDNGTFDKQYRECDLNLDHCESLTFSEYDPDGTRHGYAQCDYTGDKNSCSQYYVYDSKGREAERYYGCKTLKSNCSSIYFNDYNDEDLSAINYRECESEVRSTCHNLGFTKYNSKGDEIESYSRCDNLDDKTTCKYRQISHFDDEGNYMETCYHEEYYGCVEWNDEGECIEEDFVVDDYCY